MHHFLFPLLLVACPPPIPEDSDTGSPNPDELRLPEVPEIGVAVAQFQLDVTGCIADDVQFNSQGLDVTLASGTCLTDLQGRSVTGDVTLTLAPDAMQPPWASPDNLAFGIGVDVDLGPSGPSIDVLFDPPLAAVAELNTMDSSGAWHRTAFIDDRVLQVGSLQSEPGLAETLWIGRTGVHALTYWVQGSADTEVQRRLTCANPVTHTIDIGPASDPFPRPMSMVLINPTTGQVIAALHRAGGIPDGRSTQHIDARTGQADVEARTRAIGDRRVLEITTCYSNRLTIRYGLATDPDALIDSITVQSVDVSPSGQPESNADGVYAGVVDLTIRGWDPHGYKQLRAVREAFDTWHAQTYPADPAGTPDLTTSLFTTDDGDDQWLAKMSLHYWSQPVQDFPVARFFPDAEVTYDDRRIIVQLPCPEPRVAATTASGVQQLNPNNLTLLDGLITNPDVGITPQFVSPTLVVSQPNSGFTVTNTGTDVSQTLPVPGQTGVLVADPIDDLFWTFTQNEVLGINANTTAPDHQVPWDSFDVGDAAMRRDGGLLWLVGIDQGSPTIVQWDVVRQSPRLTTTDAVGDAWDCVSVAADGQTVWVTSVGSQTLVGIDPEDHNLLATYTVEGIQECPVLDRSGTVAAIPTRLNGTDALTMLTLDSGDSQVIATNGNRVLPAAAPAIMQVDYVFAAPDSDIVGTVQRQGPDWVPQTSDDAVLDVTGIAAQ